MRILGPECYDHHKKVRKLTKPFQLTVPQIVRLIHVFDARLTNWPFLVFDFRALWRARLSARVPESQKLIINLSIFVIGDRKDFKFDVQVECASRILRSTNRL